MVGCIRGGVVETGDKGHSAIKVEDGDVVHKGNKHSVASAHQLVKRGVPTDVSRILDVCASIEVENGPAGTVYFGQYVELGETVAHASI